MAEPLVYGFKVKAWYKECAAEGMKIMPVGIAQVGDRIHFDITPLRKDGSEFGAKDPQILAFLKTVGDVGAPAIELRWGYYDLTGRFVMCWNSTDREDPWALQSYNAPGKGRDTDNGCTPVLQVEVPLGPGVYKCVLWPCVNPADNGGLGLDGRAMQEGVARWDND